MVHATGAAGRSKNSRDPRTPHPSWRDALTGQDCERTRQIRNAEDFWQRLGI